MADKRIANLTEKTTLSLLDVFPLDSVANETNQVSFANLQKSMTKLPFLVVGTTADCDYVCDGTADDVQIQAAATALSTTGGIVYIKPGTYSLTASVTLPDNVSIQGAGAGATILLTTSAITFFITGSNCRISGLKLSGNSTGVQNGIRVISKTLVFIDECAIENMGDYGIWTSGAGVQNICISKVKITGCEYGVIVSNPSQYVTIRDSYVASSTYEGIYIRGNYCKVIDNDVISNGRQGIAIEGRVAPLSGPYSCEYNIVSGNNCVGNVNQGIDLEYDANKNFIIGNVCSSNGRGCYVAFADCDENMVIGNDFENNTSLSADAGTNTIWKDNRGDTRYMEKKYVYMKNTSGGDLTSGVVVVVKAVATGDEFTTTTTGGDNKVLGILSEDIANDAWGNVQVVGRTTILKADGTTDIAIGDYLTPFTAAGIAKKAGTGDMAFAMSLEAYTANDSSGVLTAILITPRLI